jgi:Right handed beta helix region
MRRFMILACAAALGISLSTTCAGAAFASAKSPASASRRWLIVVSPGQSIQAAVNRARPGFTILLRPGVYHQSIQIRTSGIRLLGSGNSRHGTVIKPPRHIPRTACNRAFGATGICVLAKKVNLKNGHVIKAVRNVSIARLQVRNFRGNGVFGYGTHGLSVTHVTGANDGAYGISRFASTKTLFAHDTAIGNHEAGFYVGDSPHADTVVQDNVAKRNALGIFIRHARNVAVLNNAATHNCQGILVLDDGQKGGAGNAVIQHNIVSHNNKFCAATDEAPKMQGGGVLLLGATKVLVSHNRVNGNRGRQFNSGGVVVVSARQLTHGHNPKDILVTRNTVRHNRPFDLRWDGTGKNILFVHNRCVTSSPAHLCQR